MNKIFSMTDEKYENIQMMNQKNETLEILPLDSNLIFINNSFNFFETTGKKNHIEQN